MILTYIYIYILCIIQMLYTYHYIEKPPVSEFGRSLLVISMKYVVNLTH